MKTSARNQFEGRVTALKTGAVNDEVEITTAQGVTIVAIVTHESAVGLGLALGKAAVALVKAPSVIVVTDGGGVRFSARNNLAGTVARVQAGAEVVSEPTDQPWGVRDFALRDPAGNLIRVQQLP